MRGHDDGDTRERILTVARRLFASHGYHGTHLRDIARAVGIRKASIFHHFPSKDDLYRATLERGVHEVGAVIRTALDSERAPEDRIRDLVSAYVGLVADRPESAKLLLRLSLGDAGGPVDYNDSQQIVAAVAEMIAEGQRRGIFRPIDPIALVLGVVGMVVFFSTTAELLAPAWAADADRRERIERAATEIAIRALQPPQPNATPVLFPGTTDDHTKS
jgi:TetR/AcrR family transcriptional regulator